MREAGGIKLGIEWGYVLILPICPLRSERLGTAQNQALKVYYKQVGSQNITLKQSIIHFKHVCHQVQSLQLLFHDRYLQWPWQWCMEFPHGLSILIILPLSCLWTILNVFLKSINVITEWDFLSRIPLIILRSAAKVPAFWNLNQVKHGPLIWFPVF